MAVIKKITFSDNSNNLGVNTSTPNATLDVNGNAIITGSLTVTGNLTTKGTGNFGTDGSTVAHQFNVSALNPIKLARLSSDTNYAGISFNGNVTATGIQGVYGAGDTNLYFASPNILVISTVGSERMRITNDGNVGIGTTSPSALLDVNGVANVRVSNELNWYLTTGTNGTAVSLRAFNNAKNSLVVGEIEASTLRLNTIGGNVGIGVLSPNAKLHITGSAIIDTVGGNSSLTISNSNSSGYSVLNLKNTGGTAQSYHLSVGGSAVGGLAQSFYIYDETNNATRFYVKSDGNIGIGTTSPTQKLSVNGSIESLTDTSGEGGQLILRGNTYRYNIDNYFGQALRIFREDDSNSANGTVLLYASASGNIGIGDNAPTQKLHVAGNVRITGGIYDSSNSIGTNGQVLTSTGTGLAWSSAGSGTISGTGAANYVARFSAASNITTGSLYDNGTSVGIGVTAPDVKLEVSGDVSIRSANYLYFGQYTNSIGSWATRMYALGGYHYFNANGFIFSNEGYSATEWMRITTAGNVGIGTTNPTAKLQVIGSAIIGYNSNASTSVRLDLTSGGGGYDSVIDFGYYESFDASIWNVGRKGSTGAFFISNYSSGPETNVVTITAGNNVGIGTTSPSTKLHISGSSSINENLPVLFIEQNFSGANGYGLSISRNGGGGAAALALGADSSNNGIIAANNAELRIGKSLSGTFNEYVRINSNGNVGIGITSPAQRLTVGNGGKIAVYNSGDGRRGLFFTDATGTWLESDSSGSDPLLLNSPGTNGSIRLYTVGSERMRITDNGDVGINVTPTYQANYKFLQVNGPTAAIIETMVAGNRIGGFDSDSSNLYVGSIGSYPISFRIAVVEKMRLNTNGNLGIGTTNPGFKLEVDRSSTGTVALFRGSGITTGNQINVLIGKSDSTNNTSTIIWRHAGGDGSSSNYLGIGVWDNDYILNVVANGRVGIGTTTPAYKLDVSGSVRTGDTTLYSAAGTNPKMFFSSSVGSSSIRLEVVPDGGLSFIGSNGQLFGISDSLSGSLMNVSDISGLPIFEVSSDDKVVMGKYGTNALVVTGSSIGIGTAAPAYKLHVNVASTGVGARFNNGGNYFDIGGFSSGTAYIRGWETIVQFGNSYNGHTTFITNGTERMRIDNNGNVGISTTSPSTKLDVSGSIASDTGLMGQVSAYGSGFVQFSHRSRAGTDQYSFLSGNAGDTYIGSANGYPIYFRYENSARMILTSAGNLGIGTTSPADLLNIQGTNKNIRVTNTAAYNASGTAYLGFNGYYNSSNADSWFARIVSGKENTTDGDTRGYLSIQTNNPSSGIADRVRIDSNGNLGIGTGSPTHQLSLSRAAEAAAYQININSAGGITTGNYTGIRFSQDATASTELGSIKLLYYSTGATALSFSTRYGTDAIFINNEIGAAVKIGIGTTSPNAKLDINGNTIITGSLTSSLDCNINELTVGKGKLGVSTNTAVGISALASVNDSYLASYNTAVGRTALTANTAGGSNTAIGFNTLYTNSVGSNNIALGASAIFSNTSGSYNIGIGGFGLYDVTTGTYNTALGYNTGRGITTGNYNTIIGAQVTGLSSGLSNTIIIADGQGNQRIYANSSGNVGIGTITPNAKLDVNGNVIITGSLTVTAPITASTLTVTNLNVSTVSSSVVYSSGSNVFGNSTSNKQQFTGSVQINGTLTTNDAVETTDVFGLKSFTKSLTVTTSWLDTGISGTDLATGTYILQVLVDNSDVSGGQVTEYYSGTMSWFSGATNSTEYDEIVLHKAGSNPGGNWINLRTLRQSSSSVLKLQIISNVNTSGADNYIFKFRRLI